MILEGTKKGIDSILPIPKVKFSFGKFGEPSFDVMGKCFEIIQLSPENLRDHVEIDIEVTVDEYVAKTRHISEMQCEIIG